MSITYNDPMFPVSYRISRRLKETHDIFTVELEPVDGKGINSFAPGQYNMLYLYGIGEVPISISGDPEKPAKLLHTIRAVGTVTKAMSELKKGAVIGLRGPFGSSWPLQEAQGRDLVIVAGGIGLAPLRSIIYQVLMQRESYGRVVLLYGTRTQEDILYRQELEKWRSRFDMEVRVTVDCATGQWFGNVGVVTTLIPRAVFEPGKAIAMICGPEVMMRFTIGALESKGVKDDQIYVTMERNMKCGIGFCGHCQFGPFFTCKDGPVFRYDHVKHFFGIREV